MNSSCGFELLTCGMELVNRGFELATCRSELETCISELVTCSSHSCFTSQEYQKRNIFLQKSSFVFWKNFIWSAAWFQYISIALNLTYTKNKLYKILDYWSRNKLSFDLFRKGSGNGFYTTFYEFFKKTFLMLYSIIWLNSWFYLLL